MRPPRSSCQGAELRAWHVGDVPLIWHPEPTVWPDTAPILFPVVGWTRGSQVLVDGQAHPLGLHGFARRLDFAVREQWPDHVRLVASSSAETRALYPFDWELEVEHALAGPALTTRLTVRNTGAVAMPYACGLHPGLRWPFAGGEPEDYTITFDEREAPDVPVISPDGLFTRQTRVVPLDGRRLALSPALMAREALVLPRREEPRACASDTPRQARRSTSRWRISRTWRCGRGRRAASSASSPGPATATSSTPTATSTPSPRCAGWRRARRRATRRRSPTPRRIGSREAASADRRPPLEPIPRVDPLLRSRRERAERQPSRTASTPRLDF